MVFLFSLRQLEMLRGYEMCVCVCVRVLWGMGEAVALFTCPWWSACGGKVITAAMLCDGGGIIECN